MNKEEKWSKKRSGKSYTNTFLSGPDFDPNRPAKVPKLNKDNSTPGRSLLSGHAPAFTQSIAIPSSIMHNVPTLELKTILAGQIGRMLALFQINEVIIYDDGVKETQGKSEAHLFLARLLQYMETPPYLRKTLIPISPDLKFAGLLPHLDTPHHPGIHDTTQFREGVVLDKARDETTLVDVGMARRARIDKAIKPGVRVTLQFKEPVVAANMQKGKKPLQATVVSPRAPLEKDHLYWGYTIRLATSISRVFSESPHKDGYDCTVGVSDKEGQDLYETAPSIPTSISHLLVVFGLPDGGLQAAVDSDEELKIPASETQAIFDHFVNPNSATGSASVRFEESMMLTLSMIKQAIKVNPASS